MNHNVPANKPVRRRGVTIAAAALSVALVAPFAQSVAYPEITAAAQAQEATPKRVVQTLEQNPPTFYANAEAVNREVGSRGREVGPRTVRTTGVLSLPKDEDPDTAGQQLNLFFPRGTTFRVRDLKYGFTASGWYGVARANAGDPESLKGKTSEMQAQLSGTQTAYPYVVPNTGQILFGLQERAEGTSQTVPMQARWTDSSGNEYIWNYDQEIVVGQGRTQSAAECGPGQKHVSPLSMESVRQTGSFVLGDGNTAVGSNFGWYQQPMGSIGACMNVNDLPSSKSKQVDFKYVNPEPGATTSGVPGFHQDGKPENEVKKPGKVTFELGENAPSGASVDPETGEVSFENPVDQKTTVPVKATYDDGSFDTAKVEFKPSDKRTADELTPSYKPLTLDQGQESAVDAPSFDKVETPDVETDAAPEGTTYKLKGQPNFPDGVNVQVKNDGSVSVSATENAKTGDFSIPVEVTYPDKSTDTVDLQATVNEKQAPAPAAPSISGLGNKSVVEGQDIEPISPVVENKGEGQITASGLPNGLSVDPEAGVISGTPKISDWKDSFDKENPENSKFEESRDFEVEVTVPGEPAAKQSFTVTVQRDTDGDGQPDVTDADDDGDGVPDAEELEKGSNPKDKNSTPEVAPAPAAPSISGDAAEGGNKLPEGTPTKVGQKVANPTEGMSGTVSVDGQPVDGATVDVDPQSGEITVTVPEGTLGDGVSEKPAKVQITDAGGNNVGGPIDATVTKQVTSSQADRFEPKWDEVSAVDEGGSVVIPNSGDALPEDAGVGALITPGEKNKGKDEWDISYDPATGVLTVTPGADAEPGDFVAIDVDVFYEDAEKDEDKSSDSQRIFVQVTGDGADFVDANLGAAPLNAGEGTWKDVDFSGKHKGDAGEIEGIRGSDDHNNDDLTAGDVFTEAPTVNPVNPGDNVITGTGKPGATITVTGPNGFSTTTKVNENGNWSIDVPGGATPESQYIVSQKDGDKAESDQVIVTVGKGGGKPVNPGLSSGSSNFDIPKHLQCAVFAGGVTAIPLILLSPMHNMYEMMINPHLNGLREQFHRELHALDQQVRRGLGVEGHPALQFMDHINARVNEFNQQLGQVAHDNRHIGLAAAAIAVAGLSFQHCMNTQAASSSSASSVDLSSSSQEQAPARNEAKEDNAGGIVGWFQGLFNRK